MAGEVVVRLHPLALPQPSDPDPWSVPAVALFVDRARATSADVATDSASAADVIELVRRLDGLPLALEIAAGMLSAFTPAQVQAALEAKMGSLRTRDRTLPDRQRSLEALLTSSTATLSTAEQAVFRRLSLLAGAFTLDAATAVAADAPVAPDDVPEQVWALVDRSLLLPDSGLGGSRYRMLGLVRQFGISRLERAQETEQTWEKAAAWLLDQVGPERLWVQGALGRVQGELDNVRGVVARVDRESPSEVQETAQRLALALSFYHRGVESFRSGVSELDELVHRLPTPTPARVGLLVRLARLCLDANELVKAERFLDEAQLLQQSVGPPPWDPLGAERARGELAIRRGDPASAIRVATEAMSRDLGPLPLAQMTNLLTVAYHEASEPERALAAARDCLAATEQVGDEVMLASALSNLAEAELRLSRIGEAAHYQQRALDLAQAVGKPATMAYGLNLAARISAGTDVHTPDRLQTSVSLLVRAEVAFDEAGLHLYREDADATDALLRMARVELGEERYEQARAAGAALPLAAAIDNARDILVAASVG
jgi:non-specific serine/threonine protein kinase